MNADNQQERLNAYWIVGFVDGEACFHVSINKLQKMTLGWQVLPEFRIVQHKRDLKLLYLIKSFFGFGNVVKNHGDRFEYRVRGLENLLKLIVFFDNHSLKSKKFRDYCIFKKRKTPQSISYNQEKIQINSKRMARLGYQLILGDESSKSKNHRPSCSLSRRIA